MLWLYLGRAAPALAAAVLLFGAAAHAVPLTFVSQNVTAAADAIMDGFPLDEDEDIETGSVSSFAFASAFISTGSTTSIRGVADALRTTGADFVELEFETTARYFRSSGGPALAASAHASLDAVYLFELNEAGIDLFYEYDSLGTASANSLISVVNLTSVQTIFEDAVGAGASGSLSVSGAIGDQIEVRYRRDIGVTVGSFNPASQSTIREASLRFESQAVLPPDPPSGASPMPEPASYLLFGAGLLCLIGVRRRLRHA